MSLTLSPGTGTAAPHAQKWSASMSCTFIARVIRSSKRYVTISVLRSQEAMLQSQLPSRDIATP